MKLIVNTNRIIAALVKDSTSRNILLSDKFEFLTVGITKSHLLYIPPTKVGGLQEDGIQKTLYFICRLKTAVFNVFLDQKLKSISRRL